MKPGRSTPTRLLLRTRLQVTKQYSGDAAEQEYVRLVRAFEFPRERIDAAVIEQTEQPFAGSGTRSISMGGFTRGVWLYRMQELGVPVFAIPARLWQEWAGIGGRTPRKERLKAIPVIASRLLRTDEKFHHDIGAAIVVAIYWLRNGGLNAQVEA